MAVAFKHDPAKPEETVGRIVVRCVTRDPFNGLKGHDYIKARKLNQPVKRVQTSAQSVSAPPSGGCK